MPSRSRKSTAGSDNPRRPRNSTARRQDRRGRPGEDVAARQAVLLVAQGRRQGRRRRQGSDRRLSVLFRHGALRARAMSRPGRRSSIPRSSGRSGRWRRLRGSARLILRTNWPGDGRADGLHVERPDLAARQLAGHDGDGPNPRATSDHKRLELAAPAASTSGSYSRRSRRPSSATRTCAIPGRASSTTAIPASGRRPSATTTIRRGSTS